MLASNPQGILYDLFLELKVLRSMWAQDGCVILPLCPLWLCSISHAGKTEPMQCMASSWVYKQAYFQQENSSTALLFKSRCLQSTDWKTEKSVEKGWLFSNSRPILCTVIRYLQCSISCWENNLQHFNSVFQVVLFFFSTAWVQNHALLREAAAQRWSVSDWTAGQHRNEEQIPRLELIMKAWIYLIQPLFCSIRQKHLLLCRLNMPNSKLLSGISALSYFLILV